MKSSRRCGGAVSIALRHATFNDIPTVKLYAARGYTGAEIVNYEVGPGETIEFIPMRKKLD
jgi:hypothetical protein